MAKAAAASPAHEGASAAAAWRSGLRRIGRPIRRKPERHAGIADAPACAGEAADAFAAAEPAPPADAPSCAGEAAAAFASE